MGISAKGRQVSFVDGLHNARLDGNLLGKSVCGEDGKKETKSRTHVRRRAWAHETSQPGARNRELFRPKSRPVQHTSGRVVQILPLRPNIVKPFVLRTELGPRGTAFVTKVGNPPHTSTVATYSSVLSGLVFGLEVTVKANNLGNLFRGRDGRAKYLSCSPVLTTRRKETGP